MKGSPVFAKTPEHLLKPQSDLRHLQSAY